MKSIKRFVLVASILATLSLVFVGCAMRSEQKVLYDIFVAEVVANAHKAEMPAELVKKLLDDNNEIFEPNGFMVEDKEVGKAVPKKSKADYVRKRFPTKKV